MLFRYRLRKLFRQRVAGAHSLAQQHAATGEQSTQNTRQQHDEGFARAIFFTGIEGESWYLNGSRLTSSKESFCSCAR